MVDSVTGYGLCHQGKSCGSRDATNRLANKVCRHFVTREHSCAERKSCAYHKYHLMSCFFSDIAILVAPIFALVNPIPALCSSYRFIQHTRSMQKLSHLLSKRACYMTPPAALTGNLTACLSTAPRHSCAIWSSWTRILHKNMKGDYRGQCCE